MNKEIKKKWIAALRSGKYKQGTDYLKIKGVRGTSYCCLGVLSQLAVKEKVCSEKIAFDDRGTLCEDVMVWAELDDDNPELGKHSAAQYNDGCSDFGVKKCSFEEIANKIQRHL